MPVDKQKLKKIWFRTTVIAFIAFAGLLPLFRVIGAEIIPTIILSAVCSVVFWFAILLIAVRFFVPGLSEYVNDPHVERVKDEIKVESAVQNTGDPELDKYIDGYARARDFWLKAGLTIVAGIFLVLLYLIFG